MDVILSESSDIDGYLTSHVIQFDELSPGVKVTFAVYLEFNSTTQPPDIETIVRNYLNRLTLNVFVALFFFNFGPFIVSNFL